MRLLLATVILFTTAAKAQNKFDYIRYNKLTDLKGTDYVLARVDNWQKMGSSSHYLLFINSKTGESKLADLPEKTKIHQVEQVKLDSLGINVVVVGAGIRDLDGKSGIDGSDPTQVLILSPDGRQMVQATEDRYFAETWAVNDKTGRLVISGVYDSNNNGKADKTDKNQIVVYDLKSNTVAYTF